MYKEILTPYQTPFTKTRIGLAGDGGYILFEEILSKSECIYSYGIGNEITFDKACAALGKEVYMYDHTIGGPPENNGSFHFNKNPFSSAFLNHLVENGHSDCKNITLKVDVEGAEYEGFGDCADDFDKYFSQIVIEFHGLKDGDEGKAKVLNRLNEKYYITHIHGNNHGPINGWLPDTLEITYLRKDLFEAKPAVESVPYPINGLDTPNGNHRGDYKLDWWL